MKRVVLETLFRGKLQVEIWRYKREILALEPEDIYARAYEIDHMTELYVLMNDLTEEIPEEALQMLLGMKEILILAYDHWMNTADDRIKSMEQCIWKLIGLSEKEETVRCRKEILSC